MIRILIVVFAILSVIPAESEASNLRLHQHAQAHQRIAMNVEFFDGDILTIIIPKKIWVRFLYDISGQDTRNRSVYNSLTSSIFRDGIYVLNNIPTQRNIDANSIHELKISLNRFLVPEVSLDMLGYENIQDFKSQYFDCETPNDLGYFECNLKPGAFINNQHAAYIMASNGLLLDSYGVLNFPNLRFIGKTSPW